MHDSRAEAPRYFRCDAIKILAIACARRAASRSPSVAATIEPFIRMCHERVNSVGSRRFGLARQLLDHRPGCFAGAECSPAPTGAKGASRTARSRTSTPRSPARWNHSSKTSKIASSFCFGVSCPVAAPPPRRPERPALLAALQERQDEFVLRPEVPVQRCSGYAGRLDDLVDAHIADPAMSEQVIGRGEDAFAS